MERIDSALDQAAAVFARFDRRRIAELTKEGGDPVTVVDVEIDRVLKRALLRDGEGWLSEETADDHGRLDAELVWIVDPLDGTREFIDGLPEFCTSVAAVIEGVAVAGGVINPAAGFRVVGGVGHGVRLNGTEVRIPEPIPLARMRVLASRSEVERGQWAVVQSAGIRVEPMGSVAYKMARVATGLDRATWTPVPKHEWDVAGGAALLSAVGGSAIGVEGANLVFNRPRPWLSGAIAVTPGFEVHVPEVQELIRLQTAKG